MKKLTQFILISLLFIGVSLAADKHEHHDHKIIAGPKGGKVLEVEPLHAEFFVEKDRKISITFYDEEMKPVAATDQEVKATAEASSGKTKLEFEKKEDYLLSKTELPEGDGYTVVVQIKPKPDAKTQNFRIVYNSSICEGCDRAEYACTCEDHQGHDHEGHSH